MLKSCLELCTMSRPPVIDPLDAVRCILLKEDPDTHTFACCLRPSKGTLAMTSCLLHRSRLLSASEVSLARGGAGK